MLFAVHALAGVRLRGDGSHLAALPGRQKPPTTAPRLASTRPRPTDCAPLYEEIFEGGGSLRSGYTSLAVVVVLQCVFVEAGLY